MGMEYNRMKKRNLPWTVKLLALAIVLLGGLVQQPLSVRAAQNDAEPARIEMEDGEYTVEVDLLGGTGRATITSPAELVIKEKAAFARIEWSSSHYDYMIVDGQKYLPVNEEGNSVFEIPVLAFDWEMPVIADTTAMSAPHEVEYILYFHADKIVSKKQTGGKAVQMGIAAVIVIAVLFAAAGFVFKRRRNAE